MRPHLPTRGDPPDTKKSTNVQGNRRIKGHALSCTCLAGYAKSAIKNGLLSNGSLITPKRYLPLDNDMSKNRQLLSLDILMFVQYLLVIVTGLVEHHPGPTVHSVAATFLIVYSIVHLALHQKWIANAIARYDRLPKEVRANARTDFLLLIGYAACGASGWIAMLAPFGLCAPPHWLASGLVIILQTIHLARHWKWVWATVRRGIPLRTAG